MTGLKHCQYCGDEVFDPCGTDFYMGCTLYGSRQSKAGAAEYAAKQQAKRDGDMAEEILAKSDQEFKADGGKPMPSLLEVGCVRALSVVQATLDYGMIKYERDSWKDVPGGLQRYDDAARRHRKARDEGYAFDGESQLAHLGHEIICNLFLLELMIENDPALGNVEFNPTPPQSHKKHYIDRMEDEKQATGIGYDLDNA